MKPVKKALLCFLLIAPTAAVISCSKKDEPAVQKVSVDDPFTLADTLARRIPAESVGFYYANTQGEPYQKLLNSQWGPSESVVQMLTKDPRSERIRSFLAGAGVNTENPAELAKVMPEGVGFLTVKANITETTPLPEAFAFGVIYRTAGEKTPKSVSEQLKQQLVKEQIAVEPVTLAGGEGYSFAINELVSQLADEPKSETGAPTKVIVAWNGEVGVAGSDKETIEKVLAGAPAELPTVLRSESAKKVAQRAIPSAVRNATAFFDIEALRTNPALKGAAEKMQTVPFTAVGIFSGFDTSPVTEARIIYQGQTEPQRKAIQNVGAPLSPAVLASIPAKPLFMLTLDAAFVRNVAEVLAEGELQNNPALEPLKSIKSASVALRVAPVGQSMLPVPDALIAIESSAADGLYQQIVGFSSAALQAQGPGMKLTDKTVGGVPAKTFSSGMGLGAVLARKGDLILATTTEAQMVEALKAIEGGKSEFAAVLPARSKTVMLDGTVLSSLYINFVEASAMVQNLGGMLSMFAPQAEGSELTDPKQIEQMRKLGQLSTALRLEEDQLVIRSVYDAVADQVAAK